MLEPRRNKQGKALNVFAIFPNLLGLELSHPEKDSFPVNRRTLAEIR